MASTNKTTHYDLSQYIGTDKPTYLTDYNQDMAKIDAGIYGAKSVADANTVNIGDLDDLSTTSKADLVNAINEVDSDLSSVSSQVGDNTSDIGTLQGNVGNLTNLETTAKNNLVSAINEVNDLAEDNENNIGNLNNLTTTNKSTLVGAINELNVGSPIIYKHKTKTISVTTGFNSTSIDNPDTIQGYTLVGIQNFDNGFADQNVCSYAIYSNTIYFTCYSNGNFTLALDYYEVFVRSDLIQ